MRITVVAVGKIKEAYLSQGIAEYVKRLGRFATVRVVEVAEEQAPETLSPAEQQQVLAREGERLLKHIKDGAHVIALAIDGTQFTSEGFAAHLEAQAVAGAGDLIFLIGGSLGLHSSVLAKANLRLSFSKMTFPHQLMRLILVEQVYRAVTILRGVPYHK